MVITQSPLRISLGGGGTDLPSYYNENEGFLIKRIPRGLSRDKEESLKTLWIMT